tara:strand:- start:385 stop:1092 length:708 start_codon:yes stop_codon:yes gene_type:complete
MKLDVDTKQRIMTWTYMMMEIYKVLMGTFLVIFVPQKCGNRICGATDNFFNGSIINSVGNISNFVTFSSIGTLYFIEMKRENWCIKYLDIDDNKSSNNLDEEIEKYPKYKHEMHQLNRKYLNCTYAALFLMVANFIISGFTVYQSYAGPNSVTTFISFFMLVSLKLYSSWNVGALSVKYERANSAYLREPKTYNTIDEDFRILDEENTVDIEIIENKNVENENVENKKEEQKIEL